MAKRLEYIGGGQFVYGGEHQGTDFGYPALAECIGWSIRRVQKRDGAVVRLSRRPKGGCDHNSTDGTIRCSDCGIEAGEFIAAAGEYLRDRAE